MSETNEKKEPVEAASRSSAGLGAVAWTVEGTITMRQDIAVILNWKGAWVGLGRAIPDSWKPILYA